MGAIQQAILEKKEALANAIDKAMASLGQRCAEVWPDADALDRVLQETIF